MNVAYELLFILLFIILSGKSLIAVDAIYLIPNDKKLVQFFINSKKIIHWENFLEVMKTDIYAMSTQSLNF